MALLNCKHCGGMVSDKATACPHCGAPLDVPSSDTTSSDITSNDITSSEIPSSEITEDSLPEDEGARAYEEERTSFWSPWVIVVVVALAAVAAFLLFNRNKTTDGSVADTMETDSAAVEEVDTIVHLTPEFIEAIQKYEFLDGFSEGLAAVMINDKWGFINVRGEEVISCQYDAVTSFHEGKASVKRNGKWGYINSDGELVIPYFKAQFANFFSEGLAYIVGIPVNNMYEYRVIDAQGNTVFSGKTDYDFTYDVDLQYSPAFRDGKIAIGDAVYDRTGTRLSESVPPVEYDGDYRIFLTEVDGIQLCGLKDMSGNIVIPARYSDITQTGGGKVAVHNGVVAVTLPPDNANDYLGYDFERFAGGGFFCNKWYYGYADLNGNDTFSDEFKERCSKAMREAWRKFKEEHDAEATDNNQNYSGEGGNGYGQSSSQNDEEFRIMSRLLELDNDGRKLLDELAAMRNSGNMDPWRMIYIKKRCLSIKDEQISLSQELGDYQMARQYEQQKERLVQAFRLMDP